MSDPAFSVRAWKQVAPRFVSDRFETVELPHSTLPEPEDLRPAFAASSSVRVGIDRIHGPLGARFELGDPDDAAVVALDPRPGRYMLRNAPRLVSMEARFAWTLPRDSVAYQTRASLIPVRMQLAGIILRAICLDPDPSVEYPRLTLLRRGGVWTAKSWEPFAIDDRALEPQSVVPIIDGARFRIGGRSGQFFARDADAKCRTVLAAL